MQKAAIPKGTRDFGPVVMAQRNHITSVIKEVYESFGFAPIETPSMENLSTLTGKYGEEGDKLLFKILDSGDFLSKISSEELSNSSAQNLTRKISSKGLRYDLTVPFARFVVQHQNDITFPFKRYQMQPVWRADRPQKGRYREFWQCDADVIGTDSLLCEADFLSIYHKVFTGLGLPTYVVKMNHRKILESIAETVSFGGSFTTLTTIIDKLDKIGWEKVEEELLANGLESSKAPTLKQLLQEKEFSADSIEWLNDNLVDGENKQQGISELQHLLSYHNAVSNVQMNISLDFSLARGLDYYTGCIFEAVIPDSGIGSVSGGGRYDNLTDVFGLSGVSGVGISFGLDRIHDVMTKLNLFEDHNDLGSAILFCHFDQSGKNHCLKLANQLRSQGLKCSVYPDKKKIGKQFDYANKTGYRWVIVIGDNEISEEVVQLKNLASGNQIKLTLNEVANHIHEAS